MNVCGATLDLYWCKQEQNPAQSIPMSNALSCKEKWAWTKTADLNPWKKLDLDPNVTAWTYLYIPKPPLDSNTGYESPQIIEKN